MRVLITGSRAPVAVLLARALHAAGATVFTAESLRPNFGQKSRAVAQDFLIPSPRFAPEACLAALARLATEHQIEAILPTCEETFALSAGRAALPESVQLLCPEIETLDRLHHKGRGIAFAQRLGIATPKTRATPDFLRDGILKRAYSRFSGHVIPLRGSEAQRRTTALVQPQDDGAEWVWQAWIDGQALCSYSLFGTGTLYAHAAYRTPYTLSLGAGIFYDAVGGPLFEATRTVAQTLATATGYTGALSLDFIETPSGTPVLIELNPRATMGAALLTRQPAFGHTLRALVAGEPPPEPLPHGQGRFQLTAAMLLLGRKRRWRDVLTTPDVLTDPTDPGPARAAPGIYVAYARQARRLGLTPTAFSTHDIEWNGLEAHS